MINLQRKSALWLIIIGSILILFISSSLRHILFNSSGDLAFFDQGIYLISQNKPPIASVLGFHILADHAAWIVYLLALPYKLVPSVYWLFLVQAIALGIGALPVYLLSLHSGLKSHLALLVVGIYLLYPVIYNSNLCDFHPDTIAVPAILSAILAARRHQKWWYLLSILIILSCKAILSVTVIFLGIWLVVSQPRRLYGILAIVSGTAWLIMANYWIIPGVGNELAELSRHHYRYAYLGNSWPETIDRLIHHPQVILNVIFSGANLEYLIVLFLPVFWSLKPRSLSPLIGSFPCIALNLLGSLPSQKNLVLHYSLPVLPFLILIVISSLSAGNSLAGRDPASPKHLRKRLERRFTPILRLFRFKMERFILVWAVICFLIFGKIWFFIPKYFAGLDNIVATNEAISLVSNQDSVFTTDIIAPHLTHRERISYKYDLQTIHSFKYVLLNLRHPGWAASLADYQSMVQMLQVSPNFKLKYWRDDVYLFVQK